MIELLSDPQIWIGLLTLVVLEIVLGIDNLIFIAILADKLPPHQRDKARVIGLSLALVMRLGLLTAISWLVTLTQPLFSIGPLSFSGRDLILLLGGLFAAALSGLLLMSGGLFDTPALLRMAAVLLCSCAGGVLGRALGEKKRRI